MAVRAIADEHVAIIGRSPFGTITDRLERGAFESLIRAKIAANERFSQLHEARYYGATPLRPQPLEYEPAAGGETGSAIANFTFLNPHVYLDTVMLLGSLSAQFPGNARLAYGAGAALASFAWFFGLGYGARLLQPIFARPAAWRVLDVMIGVVMAALAISLVASLF